MTTFYVLYRASDGMYIRHGRRVSLTACLNFAKHFSNRWGAEQHLKRLAGDVLGLSVHPIIVEDL